jgi:hypothetical protein
MPGTYGDALVGIVAVSKFAQVMEVRVLQIASLILNFGLRLDSTNMQELPTS